MKNLSEIDRDLRKVGSITETARLAGRTLTQTERRFIIQVRREARQRYEQRMINTIEMEGEKAVRS